MKKIFLFLSIGIMAFLSSCKDDPVNPHTQYQRYSVEEIIVDQDDPYVQQYSNYIWAVNYSFFNFYPYGNTDPNPSRQIVGANMFPLEFSCDIKGYTNLNTEDEDYNVWDIANYELHLGYFHDYSYSANFWLTLTYLYTDENKFLHFSSEISFYANNRDIIIPGEVVLKLTSDTIYTDND